MPDLSDIWFYISFADPTRPKGTQFLGGCYVKVTDEHREEDELAAQMHPRRTRELDEGDMLVVRAIRESHRLRINPGGEAQVVGPILEEQLVLAVPAENRERLLTREEIDA